MENTPQTNGLLPSLMRIITQFNVERNLDRLLDTIVQETAALLKAERGTIFLVEGDEIWSKVATGLNAGQIIRLKKDKGIAGLVASQGKVLNIPDAYADPRFNPAVDKDTGFKTRNILCLPLKTLQGEVIGSFELLNKVGGPFSKEDVEVVDMVASQAAIAIANTLLYEEVVERRNSLQDENITLKKQLKGKYAYPTIVGDSPAILQVKTAIEKVSSTNANVLVTGESGTGKELIARAIHQRSPRATHPFVALNCAALPNTLLESELFGIEKGVATGVAQRIGYLEQADKGTLFLDELGEMPLSTQVKLLRAMQERTFMRIGGNREVRVDIRIIGATNRDLKAAIQAGEFREDLYYRLNVFPIHLPPLRERRQDIPLLARFILLNLLDRLGGPPKHFTPQSMEAMSCFDWPGNVRELENLIERAVILAEGEEIDIAALLPQTAPDSLPCATVPYKMADCWGEDSLDLNQAVSHLETGLIQKALRKTGGNQLQAARLLGVSREGLRKKMARLNLNRQNDT